MLRNTLVSVSLLLVCTSQFLVADGLYGKVGIGYSMPSKQDVKSISTNAIDFENGAEIQLAVGYKLESFRFEGEYSYSNFNADKLYYPAGSESIGGSMKVQSLMANAIYDFDIDFVLKPYVGAGLGMSNVAWDMTGADDSDTVFTYQVMLGATYAVNEKMNVDVEYKYKNVGEYSIVDNGGGTGTMTNNTFSSLGVALRYKF